MRVKCPKCGFVFDVGYSRIVSCRTCALAPLGDCEFVKCPRCGHEFPYKKPTFTARRPQPSFEWLEEL